MLCFANVLLTFLYSHNVVRLRVKGLGTAVSGLVVRVSAFNQERTSSSEVRPTLHGVRCSAPLSRIIHTIMFPSSD